MANCQQHQPFRVLMEHPFCGDPSCPCSEDPALIAEVYEAVKQGLITPEEATLIIQGKTL
jgi:hypothetical protein